MQHVEAGFVAGKPGALFLHAAERAGSDVSIGFAAPRTSPVLELREFARGLADKSLYRILIAEPIAARDGVIGVIVQAVIGTHDAGRPTLGGDSMAAHGIDLGDDRDSESGIGFRDGDGGAQSGPTAAN